MSEVLTHKCPNCNGPLLFDPETQQFQCEYCLSVFTEEDIVASEKKKLTSDDHSDNLGENTSDTPKEDIPEDDMNLFSCPSCGGEIVTEATTVATYCYYCHNPVVLSGRISGSFLPDGIIPFAVEKDKAVEKFFDWGKKKRFVPSDFFSTNQVNKLTGVYFPYWVSDAELNGQYRANAHTIKVWRSGNYEYTQTNKYAIRRSGSVSLVDLVKNALKKNDKVAMVDSVQPFPMDKQIPFKSQYLAGFQAEKRDIEYADMKSDIQKEFEHYATSMFDDTVAGYSKVFNKELNMTLTSEKNQYVLLPVWLLTYTNKRMSDTPYFYAMNGQTGKVSGKLPIDKKKLAFTAVGIGLLVLAIGLIGGFLI